MAPRAPEPFHESLPEALRQVERTLDDQRAAVEALHRKNEQSIALGAGALGGGLALVVLLVERTGVHLDAALLGLMLGGATLDLAAVVVLVFAGLAASTELHLGPDVRWLREKALDETWSLLEMRLPSWPRPRGGSPSTARRWSGASGAAARACRCSCSPRCSTRRRVFIWRGG